MLLLKLIGILTDVKATITSNKVTGASKTSSTCISIGKKSSGSSVKSNTVSSGKYGIYSLDPKSIIQKNKIQKNNIGLYSRGKGSKVTPNTFSGNKKNIG
ncbi:MAG: NosD domain-containing protein [Methanobacteriaceae archaeon]